jgi:hypothetical protein
MTPRRLFLRGGMFLAAASLAAAAAAQPSVNAEEARCFRSTENQVVQVTALNEPAGGSGRLYFRWREKDDWYWVPLEHDGTGRYWVVPPKPEKRNTEVWYYATLNDGAYKEVARSITRKVKVTSDCKVDLTPQEVGGSQNLTIGETVKDQEKKTVTGFLCDGIVTRINYQNIKRADETCRACVVAFWAFKDALIPLLTAGGVGGVTTIVVDRPPASPSGPGQER